MGASQHVGKKGVGAVAEAVAAVLVSPWTFFASKLQRYILSSFLVAAGLTALVLTFVLSVGFLFQVIQFIIRGVPATLVLQYLAASLPEVLGFTVPLALMVASLLVFGRMSGDSEVAAMKACGVSFLSIMRGPIIVGLLSVGLGFYLQNYAMPSGHFVRRTLSSRLAVEAGTDLIEPGRFINEINDVSIFCDSKNEEEDEQGPYTVLYDLVAIDRSDGFSREIRAERAEVRIDGSDLLFKLYEPRISPMAEDNPNVASAKVLPYRFKNVVTRAREYHKKPKDFTFGELLAAERDAKDALNRAEAAEAAGTPIEGFSSEAAAMWHSRLLFLLNYRIVWAFSALCFVLVGIPLGCQAMRKDSSRGMALGVGVGIAFFLVLLLSESLADKPGAFPWLLVWVPVLICLGVAAYLIPKHQ